MPLSYSISPHSDVNGTPKAFPRRSTSCSRLTRDDDLIDLEFLIVCHREGYPVLEVPILVRNSPRRRLDDSSPSALRLYSEPTACGEVADR